jgi:hypothetical protein
MVVWALAFFAALAFLVQGGTLDSLSRGRSNSQEAIAARFAGAGVVAGSGDGGGDGDALALVKQLTRALDAATTALELADEEAAGLRTRLLKLGDDVPVDAVSSAKAAAVASALPPAPGRAAAFVASTSAGAGGGAESAEGAGVDGGGDGEADGIPELALAAVLAAPAPDLDCVSCFVYGPGLVKRECARAHCPATPEGSALVVATSLYGDDARYTRGVIRNAELVPIVMPGWRLRVYVKEDILPPTSILDELRSLGADIVTLTADDKRSVATQLVSAPARV